MTAQGIEAATADKTRSGLAEGESPVRQDAPNPLNQEGYSMTDTTDQQAVTVAQIDMDAAADYFEATRGERPTYCGDTVLAEMFARHRIASVSSASAETPERKETLSERQAREVMNPGFGSAVGRSDGTAWNAAASNLQKAQVAPEPVPATNQAGEADSIYGECPAHGRFARCAPCCALATQPATSQPEETWMNDPLSLDSGLPAKSQEGEAVDFAEVDAVIQEMIDVAVNDGEDCTPETDFDRGDVDRWQAKLQQATGHKNGFPSRALAATPTPPTLSEDLREALHKQVRFVVERCSNHGVLACSVMLDPTQAKWLDAALAQVKAS